MRVRRAIAGTLLAGGAMLGVKSPPAAARTPVRQRKALVTVVLAGGCYWGTESVFRHVRGVVSVTSGFGIPAGATDRQRAEAVRVTYDPARLTFHEILAVFFTVAHDPTQLDRQGPDVGAEYRSLVFAAGRRRAEVRAYIDSLTAARAFARPIVTSIAALGAFHAVDASQQNYAERHPTDPYIVTNDHPKIAALRRRFPRLYRK